MKKLVKKILKTIIPYNLRNRLKLFYRLVATPEHLNKKIENMADNKLKESIKAIARESLKDTSIIAYNCLAVDTYKYLDLQYRAPVMSLFFAHDYKNNYSKYLEDIHYYSNLPIEFLDEKHYYKPENRWHLAGVLKGTEIKLMFNHNKIDEQEKITQNWKRRTARLNMENLLIFLPYQLIEKYQHKYPRMIVLNQEEKIYIINKGKIFEYEFRARKTGETDYEYEDAKRLHVFQNIPLLIKIID